ncbi:MAG: polysaccharide biosynthesis tyrosine autokinase [Pyrinomonadaceae bacterium]
MEQDERLLPLPKTEVLQTNNNNNNDYPAAYSPFYDEESFESRRSIREYLNVVYKRLPLILALTILTTAVVALYMYRQPSIYLANTEIIIEPRKPKVQSKDSININFGNDQNYYNTQLKLFQNPELMRDVVVRLGLHRDPTLLNNQNRGILTNIRSMFSGDKTGETKESSLPILSETSPDAANSEIVVLTPEEKATAESYAGTFIGNLTIEQVEDTNLVNLSLRSTSRELAAKVVNMTAKIFIEQDIMRETQGAKRDYEDLSKSIEELKSQINGQELQLISYMRDSGLPLADKGQELSAARLQEMSTQLTQATDKKRDLEARYNAAVQANSRGEGRNIQDLTESTISIDAKRISEEKKAKLQERIRDYEKQISDAETAKAELLVRYTLEYPKVKAIQAQIEKLKENKTSTQKEITTSLDAEQKKLERESISGALITLKAQLNSAINREAQARGSYNSEIAKANLDGQNQTRLTTLKREIETNRNLLDSYIQQQKQRELEISSSRPDNIKISAEAQTPDAPVGPNRERNILIAFLVSLAAGIGLAFLMDYLDDSIRTSDDIGRNVGLPTLALIPYQSGMEKRKGLLAAKNGNGAGVGNGAGTSMALISLSDKRSAIAEAYRHLRTSLLFSSAGKPPQTILVTSSQPAEGKTTTAINTAITLAQSGADVVIIDCDLRRPRLHNHFDMENTTGLTNYLSGEKNTQNLMKTFAGLPNLKVITSGPIPPNPAELLSSNEMKNLLQFLRGKYNHVVIDSPPAISFTDAAILATLVDGVVLVAMAGKSSIHLMRRFKHRLANIGARIYGVVLNGVKADSFEYGYYGYGYAYNYYSTSEDDSSTPKMDDWEEVLSNHKTKD